MSAVREIEARAQIVLSRFFPEYAGVHCADKPDLVCEQRSIGVEVTQAVNPAVKEREAYYCKSIRGKNYTDVSKNALKKVEQYGLCVVYERDENEQRMGCPLGLSRVFGMEEFEFLHKAVKQKYGKEYRQLDRLDLYIYFSQVCRSGVIDEEFRRVMRTAHECESEYGRVFSKILIDFGKDVVILDLRTDEIISARYDDKKVYALLDHTEKTTENQNG